MPIMKKTTRNITFMNTPKKKSLSIFFSLVFVLSVPFWVLGTIKPIQLLPGLPLSALGVLAPALAACFLTYKHDDCASVLQLLRRSYDLKQIRNKGGYFAVLLVAPIIAIFAFGLMRATGVALPNPEPLTFATIPLFLFFLVGALGEEIGWSGYITEHMVLRWGTIRAGVVLGLAWAIWHFIPLAQAHRSIEWIAWWSLSTISLRVIMVWLYIRLGKSLCAVAVFHAMSNLCWQLFPVNGSYYDPQVFGLLTLGAAMAILFVDWFITKGDASAAFAK